MISAEWYLLVLSLPTRHRTARMRIWRGLKGLGCAALRDGVYMLPGGGGREALLTGWAAEADAAGGRSQVLRVTARGAEQEAEFRRLFDRAREYAGIRTELGRIRRRLELGRMRDAAARLKALRRQFELVKAADHFPGPAQDQVNEALREAEAALEARRTPDEPHFVPAEIPHCERRDFQNRTWATRRRPWVDRLASAWLIRRFIDRRPRFLWLVRPADCPRGAVGYDYDGAKFTHVGARVTFEVLLASFRLESDAALMHLGGIVHYLDAGGIPVPEAAGVESALRGARSLARSDDALLEQSTGLFDLWYAAFSDGAHGQRP